MWARRIRSVIIAEIVDSCIMNNNVMILNSWQKYFAESEICFKPAASSSTFLHSLVFSSTLCDG